MQQQATTKNASGWLEDLRKVYQMGKRRWEAAGRPRGHVEIEHGTMQCRLIGPDGVELRSSAKKESSCARLLRHAQEANAMDRPDLALRWLALARKALD